MGNWTRSARVGDSASVSFSLRQSAFPVTRIEVSLDGVIQQPVMQGADLRSATGTYFDVSGDIGTHQLLVTAYAGSCSDTQVRPMPVQVVP